MKIEKITMSNTDKSIFYIDISYKYICIELFGKMLHVRL